MGCFIAICLLQAYFSLWGAMLAKGPVGATYQKWEWPKLRAPHYAVGPMQAASKRAPMDPLQPDVRRVHRTMGAMSSRDAQTTLDAAVSALQHSAPAGFHVVGVLADEGLPIPQADRSLVANAVPRRRAEFVAGRWCAHQALRSASLPAACLPAGPLGAPCWPAGAIGSITHDVGHCVAIAGPSAPIAGIGIDWCDDSRLDGLPDLAEQILAPAERDAFARAPSRARHLQQLFCAKEAVVKAASAAAGQFLELRDIVIDSDGLDASAFHARIAGHDFVIRGRLLPVRAHALALACLMS